MSTRANLEQACSDLAGGQLPDQAGRRLVVRAVRSFMETPSRARDTMLRTEGIRERDRLLFELALNHYADLRGVRARVPVKRLTTAPGHTLQRNHTRTVAPCPTEALLLYSAPSRAPVSHRAPWPGRQGRVGTPPGGGGRFRGPSPALFT